MIIHDKIGDYGKKRVYTVSQDETVGFLIRELKKLRFRRFPVTDESSKLRGIVSVSDIMLSIFQTGTEDFLLNEIREIMTSEVIVVKYNETVGDTILTMFNSGISGMPIVKNNEIIGIFTDKDILLLDKLWTETKDTTVTAEEGIGRPITDDLIISEDFTFWQAADRLVNLPHRQLMVKGADGSFRGILTAMELANSIVKNIIVDQSTLSYLQTTKISSINIKPLFQRSSPTVLSSLRMWMNSRGIEAFPLFQHNKPAKLITEKDMVGYLAMQIESRM